MGACSYLFQNMADAFVAEAKACEIALLFAIEIRFRRIVVEGLPVGHQETEIPKRR